MYDPLALERQRIDQEHLRRHTEDVARQGEAPCHPRRRLHWIRRRGH